MCTLNSESVQTFLFFFEYWSISSTCQVTLGELRTTHAQRVPNQHGRSTSKLIWLASTTRSVHRTWGRANWMKTETFKVHSFDYTCMSICGTAEKCWRPHPVSSWELTPVGLPKMLCIMWARFVFTFLHKLNFLIDFVAHITWILFWVVCWGPSLGLMSSHSMATTTNAIATVFIVNGCVHT